MKATLTVLGSGTSMGVPTIGCDCAVCTSADPHDRRTRPSIMVQWDDHHSHAPTTGAPRPRATPCSSTPRPTFASRPSANTFARSTPCSTPTATPTIFLGSTTCGRLAFPGSPAAERSRCTPARDDGSPAECFPLHLRRGLQVRRSGASRVAAGQWSGESVWRDVYAAGGVARRRSD